LSCNVQTVVKAPNNKAELVQWWQIVVERYLNMLW
jgi:hypothetical protein